MVALRARASIQRSHWSRPCLVVHESRAIWISGWMVRVRFRHVDAEWQVLHFGVSRQPSQNCRAADKLLGQGVHGDGHPTRADCRKPRYRGGSSLKGTSWAFGLPLPAECAFDQVTAPDLSNRNSGVLLCNTICPARSSSRCAIVSVSPSSESDQWSLKWSWRSGVSNHDSITSSAPSHQARVLAVLAPIELVVSSPVVL